MYIDVIYVRTSRKSYRFKKREISIPSEYMKWRNCECILPSLVCSFCYFPFLLHVYCFCGRGGGGLLILIQPIRRNFPGSRHLKYVTTTQYLMPVSTYRHPTKQPLCSCSCLHYALLVPKLLIYHPGLVFL
jgi:hypothetical protein